VAFLCAHEHKYGIAIDPLDNHGWTPLLTAAAAGKLKACDILISHGADPTICNDQGTTPLHYLVRVLPDRAIGDQTTLLDRVRVKTTGEKHTDKHTEEDYIQMLNRAIEDHGIRAINATTMMGDTPLMNAAQRKNIVAVKWLLSRGANWRRRNQHGVTAATYAEQTLDLSIMQEMVDAMQADVESIPVVLDSRSEELRLFGSALSDLCELEKRQRLHMFDAAGIERFVSEIVSHAHVVSDFGGGDRVRLLASAVDGLMQEEKERVQHDPRPTVIPDLSDSGIAAADIEAEICGVPLIVAALSRYLRREGLKQEGLFRVSPDQVELESVISRAELFGIYDVIAQNPSAICAAALLKHYLVRRLHPPPWCQKTD
jgi:ribosomal protein S7